MDTNAKSDDLGSNPVLPHVSSVAWSVARNSVGTSFFIRKTEIITVPTLYGCYED